jgi:hypothetical protein
MRRCLRCCRQLAAQRRPQSRLEVGLDTRAGGPLCVRGIAPLRSGVSM